ncbi:MAG: hypothetical protein ACPG7T_06940, partial [Ilumatobacteraceae bacterium]
AVERGERADLVRDEPDLAMVYVEGTEGAWWADVTPKRRQEVSLTLGVVALVSVVTLVLGLVRRRLRR